MKVKISHNMAMSEILDLTITISEVIPLQHHTKLAHEQAHEQFGQTLTSSSLPHLNYDDSYAD